MYISNVSASTYRLALSALPALDVEQENFRGTVIVREPSSTTFLKPSSADGMALAACEQFFFFVSHESPDSRQSDDGSCRCPSKRIGSRRRFIFSLRRAMLFAFLSSVEKRLDLQIASSRMRLLIKNSTLKLRLMGLNSVKNNY